MPVGLFGTRDFGWRIIPIAAGFSLLIEISQLMMGRGLMELDDVIHNTLGTAIGAEVIVMWEKIETKENRSVMIMSFVLF